MNIDKRISLPLLVLSLIFTSLPVMAVTEQQKKMLDQLDQLDHQEFTAQTEKAYACIHSRDFDCAEKKIAKASKYITNPQDRNTLRTAKQDLAAERRFEKEEQVAAAERVRQIKLAEASAAQEEAERRRREERAQEKADNDQLFKGALAIAAGTYMGHATRNYSADQQSRMMTAAMDAVYNGNVEGVNSTANQVLSEKQHEHDVKMQENREQKARDRRAAQAKREREEREVAAQAKRDREQHAKTQRNIAESAAKRASDERAQAKAEATIRQQEQERLQKQARLEEQAQARKRTEAEKTRLAEQQAEKLVEHGPGSGGSKEPKSKVYRNPGEDARACVTVQSTPNSVTLTNNCGVDIFALTCGDLKYTKNRCGTGPKGGFFTQSNNIKSGESDSTYIEENGSIRWAACKGSISFGNDGEYKDYPNGSYTCLKR